MIKITRYAFMITVLLSISASGLAAADDVATLKEEIASLKQGQQQIQKDLAEIKKLLEKGARGTTGKQGFTPKDMKLADDVASKGDINAPVTLVEFSDYQCPYCKRHANAVMTEITEAYIDTGKVRFIMRENPIPNLHPRATAASTAALCAGEQGQYWGMHDALFTDQKLKTDEDFTAMAVGLGLDMARYDECYTSDRIKAEIKADQVEAQKMGVSGTPSFVLGLSDSKDPNKVHLTKFIRGAQTFITFSAAIDELLESEKAK